MGPALGTQPAGQKISNHLVWAILSTIFCCWPLGIVAIVYAAQVDGKASGGDLAGALEYSRKARTWCWVTFVAGLVVAAGWITLLLLGVVGESLFS
jgi:hypothetical protein